MLFSGFHQSVAIPTYAKDKGMVHLPIEVFIFSQQLRGEHPTVFECLLWCVGCFDRGTSEGKPCFSNGVYGNWETHGYLKTGPISLGGLSIICSTHFFGTTARCIERSIFETVRQNWEALSILKLCANSQQTFRHDSLRPVERFILHWWLLHRSCWDF